MAKRFVKGAPRGLLCAAGISMLWVLFGGIAWAAEIRTVPIPLIMPLPGLQTTLPGQTAPTLPGQTAPMLPGQTAPMLPGQQVPAPTTLTPGTLTPTIPTPATPAGLTPPSPTEQATPPSASPTQSPAQTPGQTETPPSAPGAKQAETPAPALSTIEQYFSGKVSPEVSTNLRQFGYDLFSQPPSTFAPVNQVPVGPDYVIGPGDEIRVNVWGKVEGNWDVVVDRDGNISLPKAGVVGVTGLTFSELKKLLFKELSQYYSGFDMNVSMGALRTIQVYVVGNARFPGAYKISSLSTLVGALFDSGGPSKTGTMRDIQVKRNGKTIAHFDLYDFLLKGDKTKDIRLMPEDVIFIPPIKAVAAIAGNVKRPAIYEVGKGMKITDLIKMAGGVTAAGYLQRIQLERVYKNEAKIIIDTNLKEINEKTNLVLQNGDLIRVFPISGVVVNAVTLTGNVVRPGQYQWFKGMRISDIIKDPAKDLLPETYFRHALLQRFVPPDYHREIISVNLGRALFQKDPKEDKLLQPYDTLTIYSEWEFRQKPQVRIAGAVNKPGAYELTPNMKLSDLLSLAGGPKRYAYLEQAELTRVRITNQGPKTDRLKIDLRGLMSGQSKNDLRLKQDDYLFVRTVPDWRLYRTVTISGEVKFPGEYTIRNGERLSSLIERAGGYTRTAYLPGAVFLRVSARERQQETINEMADRLEKELLASGAAETGTVVTPEEVAIRKTEEEQKRQFIQALRATKAQGRVVVRLQPLDKLKGSFDDITLEAGDTIDIPKNPEMVYTAGALYNQGAFIYQDGKGISDYIHMSGGYTQNADTKRIYIIRADGSAAKPQHGGVLGLSWDSRKHRWDNTTRRSLEPGDTIIVPEKLERIAWLRETKDLTQILYQIAVTAGVLIVVF